MVMVVHISRGQAVICHSPGNEVPQHLRSTGCVQGEVTELCQQLIKTCPMERGEQL